MLPAAARLRRSADFTATRARAPARPRGDGMVVLHAAPGDPTDERRAAARVGFVVSRAVGPAVIRNRVRRRLRHLVRTGWTGCPTAPGVVVRALPRAPRVATSAAALDARAGPGAATGPGAVVTGAG